MADSGDFETDREQIAALIANRAPELSASPTAFAGEQAGAFAQLTQSVSGNVDRALKDSPPSAVSSGQGLDNWAIAEGISDGTGAGGYGRRGATFAQGATGYLLADNGTVFPGASAGPGYQQATAAGVTLRLRDSVTVPGSPPGTGQIIGIWDADPTVAASAGTAGNLPAGTVLQLLSPPATAQSTITLQTGMAILGQPQESNSSLLTRILNKMQRPPNGGNGTDYKNWGENPTDANGNPLTQTQLFAFVFPNYYGGGTPLVVVLQSGTGQARIIPAGELAAISTFINGSTLTEGQRPVSLGAVVLSGYMPDVRGLVCRARCIPASPVQAFDWVRGTTSYTVFSKTVAGLPSWATTAGGNVVLELQTLAPLSLKDAINAGSRPHVQVDTRDTSTLLGPVIPEQWQALAYQDAAGRTSLALSVPMVANFDAWVQVGNDVYSGGPIVIPVATNIDATIDANGPSRQSGLADPAQLWQDVVGVSTISTAAENTTAADGITKLVVRCVAGGVLIGVGATGAMSAQDVPATDNTINGPEVLYAGRILVTD